MVFTSGGSESNNTAVKGFAYTFCDKGNHIIISQIEHPAVMHPCSALADVQRALGNVAVSTGSACHSGATALSPVLAAMGVKSDDAAATIRFSLGRYTTQKDFEGAEKSTMPALAEWVVESDKVITF